MVLTGERPLVEAAFLAGTGPGALVIDATGLTSACPLDLTGIVATAHWADASAIQVTLVMPEDERAAAYLKRMGVIELMPQAGRICGRVPPTDHRDRREGVMGVIALNPGNITALAEQLGPMVKRSYSDGFTTAGAAVFRACSELMANATEHGWSDRGAFIAARYYPETVSQGRRLEFAVCDTGIGVMNHLRGNRRYAHLTRDEVAIAKALEKGVSGVGDDGRGNGLSDAIEHSRRHGDLGLQIRSGRGEVRVVATPAHREDRQLDRLDQTSGTWAWLTHQLPPDCGSIVSMKPEKP